MPEIKMPKLSDTMTEGTLIAWKKKKGESVSSGEVLAEIETDKATMEWESSDDGVLTEIYVKEGEKVQVGQALALVLAKGEKAPASNGGAAAGPNAPPAETGPGAQTAKETVSAAPTVSAPRPAATPPPVSSGSTRIKASPLAKKIAAAKGLDLSRITGTGPGSRILQRDVMAAAPGTQAQAQATAVSGSMPIISPVATPDSTRLVLSGMRRTIAERLLASKTQIPHFYLHIEVDMGELLKLRSEINAATEKTDKAKITINDFVLKAAVTAATLVPKVNAAFDRDGVLEYANVNLAVAVAIDDGLVTPVIRDAGKKSLREISEAVKDLAGRARTKKLKPEEYQGGTFTVSNLGSYGIENFYAIINPPQAMILSIGAIVKKPVVNEKDQIVVGQRMSIGMSCDHRVVDGAIGAQYLAELKKLLENPAVMLI